MRWDGSFGPVNPPELRRGRAGRMTFRGRFGKAENAVLPTRGRCFFGSTAISIGSTRLGSVLSRPGGGLNEKYDENQQGKGESIFPRGTPCPSYDNSDPTTEDYEKATGRGVGNRPV
jgi:hypothetical protein